jgi:hypothetical protein
MVEVVMMMIMLVLMMVEGTQIATKGQQLFATTLLVSKILLMVIESVMLEAYSQ